MKMRKRKSPDRLTDQRRYESTIDRKRVKSFLRVNQTCGDLSGLG